MNIHASILTLSLTFLAVAAPAQQKMEPVHYFQLINCLPTTPKDWTSTKPTGAKVITGNAMVTEGRRQYANKLNSNKVVRIVITDGAYNRSMYGEFARTETFNEPTPEGYVSGYKIGGYPVHERYNRNKREGKLRGVVEGRFIVDISGFDVDPSELSGWWVLINTKQLASMH